MTNKLLRFAWIFHIVILYGISFVLGYWIVRNWATLINSSKIYIFIVCTLAMFAFATAGLWIIRKWMRQGKI